jgi:ferric-dicitrate binding protein FerR (iron transport regulator)
MAKERINLLFKRYVDKTADPSEIDELMEYIHTASDVEIESLLEESFHAQDLAGDIFSLTQRDKMLAAILPEDGKQGLQSISKRRFLSPYKVWRFSSVAALLLIACSIVLYLYRDHTKTTDLERLQQMALSDMRPGEDKATLTLTDGSVVVLNEVTLAEIAERGIKIAQTDMGLITYAANLFETERKQGNEVAYHTLATPKGGQYQVVLPDGTKVWLNASSSLRYPLSFEGNERRVILTGEGYFEVAQNAQAPFLVVTENQTVRVLGTNFNVNAYEDMPATTTTLLEGSVMIDFVGTDDKQAFHRLRPGEQASLDRGHVLAVKTVDLTNAVAWKNGFFYFENTPVEQVLAEFGRWYNFDFEFEGDIPAINLWGRVYRNVNIAEALEILDYFNLKYHLIKAYKKGEKWKIKISN